MLTLILGTCMLALTYGAFWHSQPARRRNNQTRGDDFQFGLPVNRALEWLLLIPHVSNPAENMEPILVTEERPIPKRQAVRFRAVLRAFLGRKPWHGLLITRAAVASPLHADLFKSKVDTNALAAGRAT